MVSGGRSEQNLYECTVSRTGRYRKHGVVTGVVIVWQEIKCICQRTVAEAASARPCRRSVLAVYTCETVSTQATCRDETQRGAELDADLLPREARTYVPVKIAGRTRE